MTLIFFLDSFSSWFTIMASIPLVSLFSLVSSISMITKKDNFFEEKLKSLNHWCWIVPTFLHRCHRIMTHSFKRLDPQSNVEPSITITKERPASQSRHHDKVLPLSKDNILITYFHTRNRTISRSNRVFQKLVSWKIIPKLFY